MTTKEMFEAKDVLRRAELLLEDITKMNKKRYNCRNSHRMEIAYFAEDGELMETFKFNRYGKDNELSWKEITKMVNSLFSVLTETKEKELEALTLKDTQKN